jgi:hypothetical protein
MFQHFDAVIAFVALMLVASLFITAATQLVVSLLGLRGANLRRSLVDLFETACPDQEARRWAKEIASRVLRHPTISASVFSRFCLRVDRLPAFFRCHRKASRGFWHRPKLRVLLSLRVATRIGAERKPFRSSPLQRCRALTLISCHEPTASARRLIARSHIRRINALPG